MALFLYCLTLLQTAVVLDLKYSIFYSFQNCLWRVFYGVHLSNDVTPARQLNAAQIPPARRTATSLKEQRPTQLKLTEHSLRYDIPGIWLLHTFYISCDLWRSFESCVDFLRKQFNKTEHLIVRFLTRGVAASVKSNPQPQLPAEFVAVQGEVVEVYEDRSMLMRYSETETGFCVKTWKVRPAGLEPNTTEEMRFNLTSKIPRIFWIIQQE